MGISLAIGCRKVMLDEETIIADASSERNFRLNQSASFILTELERGESLSAVSDAVAARYLFSRERAEAEVRALLHHLLTQGVLVTASDG